ncbi:glycosyltransferase [Chloroflexota bacterium]
MKKVLIIAHLNLSFGSFRPVPLAKHLPEFGWEPVILTPSRYEKPSSPFPFRVVETSYRDTLSFLKKMFRLNPNAGVGEQMKRRFGVTKRRTLLDFLLVLGEEIFYYPDSAKGWRSFALEAGEELLCEEAIKAIISCHPVTSHIVASNLRSRYEIPWVADFADLWSQNHDYHYSSLRRLLDRRLELKTLSGADALVTVSESWAEKLRALHKEKPVYAITHGFNPEEVNIPPANLAPKFTITYTGTIYSRGQDSTKLFAALRDLVSEKVLDRSDVEVRFYGTKLAWLDKEIRRYGLSDIVKQYGRVAKEVALDKQKESHLLLLLDWDDQSEKGVYSGKVFEYLGARRPILATGGSYDNVVHKLLAETGSGIHSTNVVDIKRTFTELYQEYKLKGAVDYNGMEREVNKYSHREMARKFSEVLNRLV